MRKFQTLFFVLLTACFLASSACGTGKNSEKQRIRTIGSVITWKFYCSKALRSPIRARAFIRERRMKNGWWA